LELKELQRQLKTMTAGSKSDSKQQQQQQQQPQQPQQQPQQSNEKTDNELPASTVQSTSTSTTSTTSTDTTTQPTTATQVIAVDSSPIENRWKIENIICRETLVGHRSGISALAVCEKKGLLVSASHDAMIRVGFKYG
jgi:hypothetical protein